MAHQRDARVVAAEGTDVLLDPVEGRYLIEQGVVGYIVRIDAGSQET